MARSDRSFRGAAVREIDLHSWFADSELEPCLCCQRKSALPTPAGGLRVCLGYGLVTPQGERLADLHSPRVPNAA
jgi:hypothetical protein